MLGVFAVREFDDGVHDDVATVFCEIANAIAETATQG